MIDLSISIVSYRNFSDVSRLIETIESFTSWKVSKQIYIIDNADEESKYKEIVKKYNDVTYVHTGANLGFGKGHNLVLNQISSRYHAIVNPDIILKEDSFSKIIAYMDKNNEVGMCVPRIIDEQGNLQYVCRKK